VPYPFKKNIYLFFGGVTFIIAILAWIGFDHFKDDVVQDKKLKLKSKIKNLRFKS